MKKKKYWYEKKILFISFWVMQDDGDDSKTFYTK